MRVLLRDLTPGTEYAIQFRSNSGENVSEWSQVQRFTTTNDTIRPGNVLNLTWYDSGNAFIGQWDKVVTDEFGNPLRDFRHYRVNISAGTSGVDILVPGEKVVFSREENIAAFGSFQTALTIKVWAVDMTYNESPTVATAVANPLNPPVPSTPTLSNFLGQMLVTWNGLSNAGSAMPANFEYAEVHASTSSTFTPATATLVGRIVDAGSASKWSIEGLAYDTTYYIRLVAVNSLGKRSAGSAAASASISRLSGLDIQNGQISAEQINWVATTIPGAHAYYSTSQPTTPIGGGSFVTGDIWYDTDNGYTTYKYNGTNWVLDPTVGFIPAGKLVAGTITADKIGANQIITSHMDVGSINGDRITVSSLSASKISTGSISASQKIIAGDANAAHAEVRSDGFYVVGPDAGGDPLAPPIMRERIKMGTDSNDYFAIADVNNPGVNLAQIADDGGATFQKLAVKEEPNFMGQPLTELLDNYGGRIVAKAHIGPINGLNQSGSQGIRSEYGIGQVSFPVVSGRSYQIWMRFATYYANYVNPYLAVRFRTQQDTRTPAQIADPSTVPTPVTNSSSILLTELDRSFASSGWSNEFQKEAVFDATFTGIVTVGMSIEAGNFSASTDVVKIYDGSYLDIRAIDIGKTPAATGNPSNQGGTLYSWTAPPPPPPPATQQYFSQTAANEFYVIKVRSGVISEMTNWGGHVYQGYEPSYNGDQGSQLYWSSSDWASFFGGGRVDQMDLYLYFEHWWNASGGTARIGLHGNWGRTGWNGNMWPRQWDVGFARGEGKWLNINGWAGGFQNGTYRGIMLGQGASTSATYYGYASGTTGNPPLLRGWVTK